MDIFDILHTMLTEGKLVPNTDTAVRHGLFEYSIYEMSALALAKFIVEAVPKGWAVLNVSELGRKMTKVGGEMTRIQELQVVIYRPIVPPCRNCGGTTKT